ncbi:Surfeit locus 1 family protein [Sphingomonas sp. Leaf17]|uniref:SURF1 family protein n=1 Tax=Sphingomonas sp. Leaf17 TaxID=1735683 RepID=UPI0006FFC77D|nr:SURF1 family protein [Sphingomonas sp. Leaf17]KQM64992.1 Surfeit locus 1 family protein [Sphingomonas sp. Leaf17]
MTARVDRTVGAARSARSTVLLGLLALLMVVALVALGTWQVQRRAWKLDLIAQVDARLKAPPVPAPGPAAWPRIDKTDAYTRLHADGIWLVSMDTLVKAVTTRGSGWWVMTPLRTRDGATILVNRGFVPARTYRHAEGPASVTGLLRVSEPGGAFLRSNDPAAGAWYSRDVAAIAAHHRLDMVAPYFIDANAVPGPADAPVGGLTIVSFYNNHLVYALTWYGLALMVAGGYALLLRERARRRAATPDPSR